MKQISVEVNEINKSFGTVRALENISFDIQCGELFGIIGSDGAGKTTLIRILTTVLLPDSGSASIEGINISEYKKIRNIVGYMPGRFSLYSDLTVEENIRFFATISGTTLEENYYLIKDIYSHIEPFRNRRAADLSGGMKQKLALSCSLIHKPKLLLLDEPTTGIDAVSRTEFWEMLKKLISQGITILVSTSYMDEVENCNRIALMHNGRIMKIDTPSGITNQFNKNILAVRSEQTYRLIKDLEVFPHTLSALPFGQYLHYTDKRKTCDPKEISDYLLQRGHTNIETKSVAPSVEDCFLDLIIKEKKEA